MSALRETATFNLEIKRNLHNYFIGEVQFVQQVRHPDIAKHESRSRRKRLIEQFGKHVDEIVRGVI